MSKEKKNVGPDGLERDGAVSRKEATVIRFPENRSVARSTALHDLDRAGEPNVVQFRRPGRLSGMPFDSRTPVRLGAHVGAAVGNNDLAQRMVRNSVASAPFLALMGIGYWSLSTLAMTSMMPSGIFWFLPSGVAAASKQTNAGHRTV